MIGCFWRVRRLWSRSDEGPSTGDEFRPPDQRIRGPKSTVVEFDATSRPEPRTPGPGAAWIGGRP